MRPHHQRREAVFEILDRKWQQGLSLQKQLIKAVKRETGQGCSPKLIVSWKRARKIPTRIGTKKSDVFDDFCWN